MASCFGIFPGVLILHFHVVVWVDHRIAQVYGFGQRRAEFANCVKNSGPHHIHRNAETAGSGHERDMPTFFREIAAHLASAGTILIVGPAQAKSELKTYLDAHAPAIAAKVVGVEPLDAESEGEIIACARKFFLPL